MILYYARAYYGIDTITVAKGRTRAACERNLEKYKRERNRLEPFCLSSWMFWIEGPAQ